MQKWLTNAARAWQGLLDQVPVAVAVLCLGFLSVPVRRWYKVDPSSMRRYGVLGAVAGHDGESRNQAMAVNDIPHCGGRRFWGECGGKNKLDMLVKPQPTHVSNLVALLDRVTVCDYKQAFLEGNQLLQKCESPGKQWHGRWRERPQYREAPGELVGWYREMREQRIDEVRTTDVLHAVYHPRLEYVLLLHVRTEGFCDSAVGLCEVVVLVIQRVV